MSEVALSVYLIGFAVLLGWEWQAGPNSNDESPVLGWVAAVFWPITWMARAGYFLGIR